MSQIRPKILLRYGRINEPIRVPIYDLLVDPQYQTFITVNTSAGSGSLTVKNGLGFAIDNLILVGESGNQGSEILKTNHTVVPTLSTIALVGNTSFPHSASDNVYLLNFDQVEISWSATATGAKTVLATLNILANAETTDYNDVVHTTGFYFTRFKNSITSVFSTYSDATPITGYTRLMARTLIDNALEMINKDSSPVMTDEYAFKQIDNCQMETLREFKRWSFMQAFDVVIGNTSQGKWRIDLPANCDDQNTTKSVYNFHIGKEDMMIWVDKEEWNAIIAGFAYTTLATNIIVGAISIVLTDSTDFNDSGSVMIGENNYAYTANNRITGTLTIASSTTINTAGEDAFQNVAFGNPVYYTVFDGQIWHYPIISSVYKNRNYYLDYYKSLTQINTDTDQTVLPDPTIVQYYLAWKFLLRLNNGEDNTATQSMFNQYILRREKLKQKEALNRQFILNPNVDDYDTWGSAY